MKDKTKKQEIMLVLVQNISLTLLTTPNLSWVDLEGGKGWNPITFEITGGEYWCSKARNGMML